MQIAQMNRSLEPGSRDHACISQYVEIEIEMKMEVEMEIGKWRGEEEAACSLLPLKLVGGL
jgi:fructose/tagatose bisphosphate aldolase